MASIRSRRTLIVSAVFALCVWFAAVVAVTLWRYPQFWVEPHDRMARAQRLFDEGRHSAAVAELDRAIAADPDNAGYLVFKGYRQTDLGDARGAEDSFRGVLRINPADLEARLGLASALTAQNRGDEALAELEQLQVDGMTAGHVRRRSQLYGALQAPGPALADLSHLLRSGSTDPELLREATTHAHTLGDWSRVLTLTDWLLSAVIDEETRRWAAGRRAIALDALGRGEAAFEHFQIAADPDHLEQRAELAIRLRKYSEAEVLYEELSRRDVHEPRFRRARTFALLSAGRRAEAEAAFRELIDSGAADLDTRVAYAWLLNVQHRYTEAWLAIEPLPRPARDPSLLELQARTAFWDSRAVEAVQLLRALLRVRPHDPQLWKDLADAAHAARDDRQAADALAAYVRLQSGDAAARQRLAEILARSGAVDTAIDHYRRLLTDDPANADVATALGLLYEAGGDLEAAKSAYLQALPHSAQDHPALQLRLARLHRWTGEPRVAMEWYERYFSLAVDEEVEQLARSEYALALLDAGEAARSLAVLEPMVQGSERHEEALLTAARAATAVRRPDLAASFLELLAAVRPLSPQEQSWLAGQYRATGQLVAALQAYERAVSAQSPPDPLALEAVADLRYGQGDYDGALEMLQRIGTAGDVRLKLARIAAVKGDLDLAAQTYVRYTTERPGEVDAQLEAARFFAASGQPQRAIGHYSQVTGARGVEELRLELARIHLAAGNFDAAEGWARQAVAAGEDVDDARLALGQALHLQGRSAAADAVLRQAAAAGSATPDVRVWRGHVAGAMDRHLAAFREWQGALSEGADGGEQIALWISTAARKRGDYTRALSGVEHAAVLGADAPQVAAAERELRIASSPSISFPAWVQSDTNGLRLDQAGMGVRFFLPRLTASVSVDGMFGRLAQHSLETTYTSAVMTLTQLFPAPQLELGGRLGLHQFAGSPDLISWRGTATWHLTDDARAALTFGRRPVLPLFGPTPLREFNRVLDASGVGPDFFSDGLQVVAEFLARPFHRARLEAGVERLGDRNRQRWLYGHYQLPLSSSARQWTALRPNVYFETFQRNLDSYFSPGRHLTIGAMLHGIRQYPQWEIELELNPQILRTDGATGWASHGVLNLKLRAGRATLDAGTFVFYDGLQDYLQWRFGARVTIPIRR